jgi:hypothetical protein
MIARSDAPAIAADVASPDREPIRRSVQRSAPVPITSRLGPGDLRGSKTHHRVCFLLMWGLTGSEIADEIVVWCDRFCMRLSVRRVR